MLAAVLRGQRNICKDIWFQICLNLSWPLLPLHTTALHIEKSSSSINQFHYVWKSFDMCAVPPSAGTTPIQSSLLIPKNPKVSNLKNKLRWLRWCHSLSTAKARSHVPPLRCTENGLLRVIQRVTTLRSIVHGSINFSWPFFSSAVTEENTGSVIRAVVCVLFAVSASVFQAGRNLWLQSSFVSGEDVGKSRGWRLRPEAYARTRAPRCGGVKQWLR